MKKMRGAKAVNFTSRVLKIIGTVLVLISLVLFLYAVINTGGRWGELNNDMAAFHVETGIFDRIRFDNQFFSSLSTATRVIAEEGMDSHGQLSDDQASVLADAIGPYFKPSYDKARANVNTAYAEEDEAVYRWFEEEMDIDAIIEAGDDIEAILQSNEIDEIFEFLNALYKPAKKAKVAMANPDQRPHFEKYFLEYRASHPEDDSSWFEFMSAIRLMVQWEQESGTAITSQAKDWYAKSFDDETYQRALAEVRRQERNETPDNFVVRLIDLCERKRAGETVDIRGFLHETYESMKARYPDDDIGDEHVFLLSIKGLTETLIPTKAEGGESADTAEDAAPAGEEETAAGETEASEPEAGAGETADTDGELLSEEELLIPEITVRTGFDGSYSKVRDRMIRQKRAIDESGPDIRERKYVGNLVKEAFERASIGTTVSVFWAVVAHYMLIFLAGVGLLILAWLMKRILHKVLLNSGSGRTREEVTKEAASVEAPEQPEAFGEDVLLRVSHLKQYFSSGSYVNRAVDDISFYVKKGEVFGLVGESGCGKTTTGRTIINLYDPTDGDVYFEGLRVSSNLNGLPALRSALRNDYAAKIKAAKASGDASAVSELKRELRAKLSAAGTNALISQVEKNRADKLYRERRIKELNEAFERDSTGMSQADLKAAKKKLRQDIRVAKKDSVMSRMQMIFQDPIASINPRMTVREIIAEGLIIQGVKDKDYINEKVYEMLELVGLVREHADRYPHEFSGGQRQRIGIARAIIMNPDLIIADEPISALDVSIQAQVINLLNDLRERMGLTIMFIAHNLSVVKYFSDRIAVMYYGHIVEMTTSDELFAHPLHPYTKSLLSAIPYPDPHYEKVRQRIEYNPFQAHDYSVDKPSLREITPGHYIHCNDAEFAAYQRELGL